MQFYFSSLYLGPINSDIAVQRHSVKTYSENTETAIGGVL